MKTLRLLTLTVASVLLLSPVPANACGVCMGQSDGSQIGGAVNGAIFVMLGFLALMMAGIGGMAYSIWKRSSSPLPPHLELAEMIGTQPTSK